jgi:glycine hydroxymethyltransferase
MILGGPLPHVMAAKAVAFREATAPSFKTYAQSIVDNSQALAQACIELGMDVPTGGTDNHLMLVDVAKSFDLTGRQAESALRECHVTLNRNSLPFDVNGPWYTSGLRIGTPAVTTLGMGTKDMGEIASIIKLVLSNTSATTTSKGEKSRANYKITDGIAAEAQERVLGLLKAHLLYPELDVEPQPILA